MKSAPDLPSLARIVRRIVRALAICDNWRILCPAGCQEISRARLFVADSASAPAPYVPWEDWNRPGRSRSWHWPEDEWNSQYGSVIGCQLFGFEPRLSLQRPGE